MSAKCTVCDKTCGSVLRLQDWRCLWCKAMVSGQAARAWHLLPVRSQLVPKCPFPKWQGVFRGLPVTPCDVFQVHTSCKESLQTKCPLGLCKVSVIPPTALNSIDSDGGCFVLSWLTHILPFPAPG